MPSACSSLGAGYSTQTLYSVFSLKIRKQQILSHSQDESLINNMASNKNKAEKEKSGDYYVLVLPQHCSVTKKRGNWSYSFNVKSCFNALNGCASHLHNRRWLFLRKHSLSAIYPMPWFPFVVLRIEPRTLCMINMCSIPESHPLSMYHKHGL